MITAKEARNLNITYERELKKIENIIIVSSKVWKKSSIKITLPYHWKEIIKTLRKNGFEIEKTTDILGKEILIIYW
jgi:hypothetical protein